MDKKRKHELISAPFIVRRRRRGNQAGAIANKDADQQVIDPRFDPSTFVDLSKEAEIFFGSGLPFWSRPLELLAASRSRRSSSVSSNKRRSSQWTFPLTLGFWTLFVNAFENKPNTLRKRSSTATATSPPALSHRESSQPDEYYNCSSSLLGKRPSTVLDKRRSPISSPRIVVHEPDSVEF